MNAGQVKAMVEKASHQGRPVLHGGRHLYSVLPVRLTLPSRSPCVLMGG